jgi:hypothetical protein
MGLENDPSTKGLQVVGVKTIENGIHCLNCDKLLKDHSKNGLIRCFYVVQTHAVKWGSELRERMQIDKEQMEQMDKKQNEEIKIDQAQRPHTTVGKADGVEVHMMDNEIEVADNDPHKIKFLKDNPQWETNETPITEEGKEVLKNMEGDMKVVGMPNAVETIKDGKATGNKVKKNAKAKASKKT